MHPSQPIYTAEDYWSLPDGVRAELIDGKLWDIASPNRLHQEIVMELACEIGHYIQSHGDTYEVYLGPLAVNLFADETTFVEPDIMVICDRQKLSDRGCEGAPDLIVEVVGPSSRTMDHITKLVLYRDAGVREYWICDPMSECVNVYVFESEDLVHCYGFDEPVPCSVLPGFEVSLSQLVADM